MLYGYSSEVHNLPRVTLHLISKLDRVEGGPSCLRHALYHWLGLNQWILQSGNWIILGPGFFVCTEKILSDSQILCIKMYIIIIKFSKPLTSVTFYSASCILLRCRHWGQDWLSTLSAVAGATFMNEFAPYAMQAPPLKRCTRQRFTEFDYSYNQNALVLRYYWFTNKTDVCIHCASNSKWTNCSDIRFSWSVQYSRNKLIRIVHNIKEDLSSQTKSKI